MDAYDVVILGAGYGGLTCAVRLAGRTRRRPLRVALVGKNGMFLERLRLHEGLANPAFVPPVRLPKLRALLEGTDCTFIEGEVAAIDRAGRTVGITTADGGSRISYGLLVVALGSRVATRIQGAEVPGVSQHAYLLDADDPRGQPTLRQRLATLALPEPHIVIVGGGATGIEAAGELAQIRGARVTILDAGDFASFATPAVRKRLNGAVSRAGIAVQRRTSSDVPSGSTVRPCHPHRMS